MYIYICNIYIYKYKNQPFDNFKNQVPRWICLWIWAEFLAKLSWACISLDMHLFTTPPLFFQNWRVILYTYNITYCILCKDTTTGFNWILPYEYAHRCVMAYIHGH